MLYIQGSEPDGLFLGPGWRKLPCTWAPATRIWLWREVLRVSLKEAEKLLKVMGNHTVLELYRSIWLALSVQHTWLCGSQLCGCRGKPVREPVRGGRPLCSGWTASRWLVMSFHGHEAAVLGESWLRAVLGPLT